MATSDCLIHYQLVDPFPHQSAHTTCREGTKMNQHLLAGDEEEDSTGEEEEEEDSMREEEEDSMEDDMVEYG